MVLSDLLKSVEGIAPRVINVNGEPYLSRYYLKTLPGGAQLWLHRFHTSDGDEHLHNHAWTATSWVVLGGYEEEFLTVHGLRVRRRQAPVGRVTRAQLVGQVAAGFVTPRNGALIGPDHWHRVRSVEPETWTVLVVEPGRRRWWYFLDTAGQPHPDGPRLSAHDGPPELVHPDWRLVKMASAGEGWHL